MLKATYAKLLTVAMTVILIVLAAGVGSTTPPQTNLGASLNGDSQRWLLVRPATEGYSISLEKEPVIAELSGTYLLEYDSPETAAEAETRIKESGNGIVEAISQIESSDSIENAKDLGYNSDNNPIAVSSEIISNLDTENTVSNHDKPVIAVIDSGGEGTAGTYSLVGNDTSDPTGHGSEVIAKIREGAPDAEIISIKVTDDTGAASTASVYSGIKTASALNADIINISLYGLRSSHSELIDTAIEEATEAGLDIVCAAGNDSADVSNYVPASSQKAITAGSCDFSGHIADFSNYGNNVDVYVAGTNSTSLAAADVSAFLACSGEYENAKDVLATQYGKGIFYSDVLPEGEQLASTPQSELASLPDDDPSLIGAATTKIKIVTHTSNQVSYDSKLQSTCWRFTGAKVSQRNSRAKNERVGTIAFCVIPSKGGIANGYYNSTTLTASRCSNKSSWYNVALAAMYYGYGGPGFNATTKQWYPSKTYNNKKMTNGQRFATMHMLLSAIHMGGIKKAGPSSKYQSWFTKNIFNPSNITSTSTYAGKLLSHYNDKDMMANGGYTMAEWAATVYYMPTKSNMQDFMTYIPLEKNSLSLVKNSTRPSLTNSSSKYSLKDALYGIYTSKTAAQTHQAAKAIATYRTDKNGAFTTAASFTHGTTYYIAEITPSKGFQLDQNIYSVVASKSSIKKVTSKEAPNVSTTVVLEATKQLTGRSLQNGEFTFDLKDANGRILQAKTNRADGKVIFDALTFTSAGTHTYTIVEEKGNDPRIKYDTTPETVTVTVANSNTGLSASVKYQRTGNSTPGTFNNIYKVDGSVTVKKVDAEDGTTPLRGAVFSVFTGSHSSGEEAMANGTLVGTATTKADGTATVEGLDIAASGSTYTIVETKAPNGYYLSGDGDDIDPSNVHRYYHTFTLTESQPSMNLTSTPVQNARKGAIVSLECRKILENGTLEPGAYTFELEALETESGLAPMPSAAGGSTTMTATNDGSGMVFFGKVNFSNSSYVGKTYKYRIREIVPENRNKRIQYDETARICEVQVRLSAADNTTIITTTKYYKEIDGTEG